MALFRTRELSLFYQQLGQLYKSGIPPTEAVPFAAAQSNDSGIKTAAAQIHQQVLAGRTLGSAFAAHPAVFSELQVALITIGEENGTLPRNLALLADMFEKEYGQRKKLVLALLYPAFLFVAALFLPKLYIWVTGTFTEYLAEVFSTSVPFLVLFAVLFGIYKLSGTVLLRALDQIKLEVPVLGKNLRKLALARFARSFAMLYGGGVELRRSLRLALKSFGNTYLEERSRVVDTYLHEGGTLTDGFMAARVFPGEFVQIIALGEKTGELDKMLEQTARLYEDEADKVINSFLFFLPIAIYLLVALYIAFIVISVFAGYYNNIGKMANP
ncbi:MAG: type II secretion system F family protein [Blastocatellia bacterium]|nr:type II secretion system F family protein [Blastocatellia bacterium]